MQRITFLLAITLIICDSAISHAQGPRTSATPQVDIRRFMNATDFRASGLDKLTSQELEALNQWLGRFTTQVYQTAQGSGGGGCANVIESQVDGTFNGWTGETVFKLTNGQIWQQSSYSYTYHYAYRPEVTIFASGSGCKMKVEGVSDSISVRRLK